MHKTAPFTPVGLLDHEQGLKPTSDPLRLLLVRHRTTTSCWLNPLAKIPDIEKCLEVVATLQARKGTDSDSVCLWLGANVIPEYSCEEIHYHRITSDNICCSINLENAKASLEILVADLQFLSDQVTVTQEILVNFIQLSQRLTIYLSVTSRLPLRVKQVTSTPIAAAEEQHRSVLVMRVMTAKSVNEKQK
ncbi:unnamed protein product [Thlaspi arvense]|uniref:Uncharacterized protein n=1 Tax=Thlaspi arvense TaxID=13288 RepID=A0AAU9RJT8_THLAR|nr:unnamed protein product [Thlaspi arvense]